MPAYELNPRIGVGRDETEDEDSCDAECIEGRVQGLAVVEEGDRHGVLIVEDDGGTEQFKITAAHTYPILEDAYTMIYTCRFVGSRGHGWVVGRSLPGGKFEKVATLEISHEEQRSLKAVYSFERHRYILI